ncbi:MAG TPA: spore coat U domain-containing protein [Ensifer sp.]|jgi:spore coat protein U-like protein|uniref:Csu type fimbrial protein n=1 Tax=Ensifer sp. TaxID=1872086 RepID=UPI002E1007BC|nr:spore coat U domain-containing protein [Ensifer sp.]
MPLMRYRFLVTFLFAGGTSPGVAAAQSCNFSLSNLDFAQVDTLSGLESTSTATLTASCTGLLLSRILVCPGIGAGSGGATASARQMLSGAATLNYQLYSDPARSIIWGSQQWSYPSRPPALPVNLGLLGSGQAQITIYGKVFANQIGSAPGVYMSTFTGSDMAFSYQYSSSSDCTQAAGTVVHPGFNVNAFVAANCAVTTQPVDFGAVGVLSRNVDSEGAVIVTCTPGTAYTIGLGTASGGGNPTARKMTNASQSVTYGLYKDSAHTQPWGDSALPGSTVGGVGAGAGQTFTVFGRVPPQTSPSAGVFTDTVIVSVTY